MKSLADKICIGTHHHFSVGSISKAGVFSGHTLGIDVIAHGPINQETGMILDFGPFKKGVRNIIDGEFDHAVIVPRGGKVGKVLRKQNQRVIETLEGDVEGLPITLFDRLRQIHIENVQVRKMILKTGDNEGWITERSDNNVGVITSSIIPAKEGTAWTCDLHFMHSIQGVEKCDNIHGHTWKPKITFSRPLSPKEYKHITQRLDEVLKENWNNHVVFQKGHEFDGVIKGRNIKILQTPPTTEIISMKMIREIEALLREESDNIRLQHFELWETPTNFVTT